MTALTVITGSSVIGNYRSMFHDMCGRTCTLSDQAIIDTFNEHCITETDDAVVRDANYSLPQMTEFLLTCRSLSDRTVLMELYSKQKAHVETPVKKWSVSVSNDGQHEQMDDDELRVAVCMKLSDGWNTLGNVITVARGSTYIVIDAYSSSECSCIFAAVLNKTA
jgi:hypothetical protein